MFLLIGDIYPLNAASERDGVALIEKGEAEYSDGFYRKALDTLNKASAMVQKTNNRERLLLDIALVHFAIGDNDKCSETINIFLKENPKKKINREKFPKGFLQVYDQTQFLIQEKIAEEERRDELNRVEDLKMAGERIKLEKERSQAEKKEAELVVTKEKAETFQPSVKE